jgi:hypothetical protein
MNLLLKLYGLSYPIVKAIPKCSAGSGRGTENVHPFLDHDSLLGGRDLLHALSGCTLQRVEAAPPPHPSGVTTVGDKAEIKLAAAEIPQFVGRSADFRNPLKHQIS